MVELGEGSEGSEAGRAPRPSHEIDLSHLSRTPADTPPWTPAYSLPPPVAHVPSNQVGAAPRGSSRVYANPRAPTLAKRPAKLSPRKAPRHLIDWGPSPHTSDAERAAVRMPEKPPPLHTDANADADANAANADASADADADANADANADADADANADANTDAYSDARVTSATLLTPPSRPPLVVAHPHARRVEMGRWKQGVESRAWKVDLQRPRVRRPPRPKAEGRDSTPWRARRPRPAGPPRGVATAARLGHPFQRANPTRGPEGAMRGLGGG